MYEEEPIRVLMIEDSEVDAELIREEMTRAGIPFTWSHVSEEDQYLKAFESFRPELVLSDFCLPSYDGFLALDAARERDAEIPFIFVSGAIGEDLAIEALKRGATDCVNKSHLGKLPGAVRRAIEEYRERRHRQRAEKALDRLRYRNSLILDSAGEGIMGLDADLRFTFLNRSALAMLRCGIQDIHGESLGVILEGGIDSLRPVFEKRGPAAGGAGPDTIANLELVVRSFDGSTFPAECTVSSVVEKDAPSGYVVTMKDVTERIRAREEIERGIERLRKILLDSIHAMSHALELRDPYTAGHQKRVSDLAVAIAEKMGVEKDKTTGIYLSGLVHDIGKIAVPAEILSKPAKLSAVEFDMIKVHPEAGYGILRNIDYTWPIADAVYQHHERLDGSGYPRGIAGDEIILEARILAVADVVEAMASHRPYRPSLGTDRAMSEIRNGAGRIYDRDVSETCLKLFEEGFAFK